MFNKSGSGEGYSEMALQSKWKQGFGKGPFYTKPMVSEPITFVNGLDPAVKTVRQEGPTKGTKTTKPNG